MSLHCERWLVSGQVQGVGYRAWMVRQAQGHGVSGWVRNLADGRVEAMVQAEASILHALLAEARQGPRASVVHSVTVDAWTGEAPGPGFRQRPTAATPEAAPPVGDAATA